MHFPKKYFRLIFTVDPINFCILLFLHMFRYEMFRLSHLLFRIFNFPTQRHNRRIKLNSAIKSTKLLFSSYRNWTLLLYIINLLLTVYCFPLLLHVISPDVDATILRMHLKFLMQKLTFGNVYLFKCVL